MKNCDKIKPLLLWYIEQSLNRKQMRMVEQHLQTCPDCTRHLTELKHVFKTVSEVKPVEVPATFYARLNQRIESEQVTPVYQPWLQNVWTYTRWGLVTAILLFFVVTLKNQVPITPLNHEITKKVDSSQIVLAPERERIKVRGSEKTVKPIPSETVSIPSPLRGEGQGEVKHEKSIVSVSAKSAEQKKIVNLPETVQTQETQKPATTILTKQPEKETIPAQKQEVVNILVNQGVPAKTAQRNIETAITQGRSVSELNQMVTNPTKGKVYSSIKRTEQLATSFKFEEVQQNPFTPNGDGTNDEVIFIYQNPEGLDVTIKIYDVTDAVIKNIEVPAGINNPSWNGTNESSDLVESGLYFYILKAGNNIIKGTIILAK